MYSCTRYMICVSDVAAGLTQCWTWTQGVYTCVMALSFLTICLSCFYSSPASAVPPERTPEQICCARCERCRDEADVMIAAYALDMCFHNYNTGLRICAFSCVSAALDRSKPCLLVFQPAVAVKQLPVAYNECVSIPVLYVAIQARNHAPNLDDLVKASNNARELRSQLYRCFATARSFMLHG
jgi:hypothetical protein